MICAAIKHALRWLDWQVFGRPVPFDYESRTTRD